MNLNPFRLCSLPIISACLYYTLVSMLLKYIFQFLWTILIVFLIT